MAKYIGSPEEIKENNKGIFEVQGNMNEILIYLDEGLDLKEFRDYVFVANMPIRVPETYYPFMIHFVSDKGFARFVQSGVGNASSAGVTIVRKWLIPDLKKVGYGLWVN